MTSPEAQQKKIALVQKETSPKEFFQYLIELLDTYPHHQFMAIWQRKQLDDLLENLPLGHVVCIHDYSESHACRGQNEIQPQHFDVNKASLHITVIFRHATMKADGKKSTPEEPVVIKGHVFVISDDLVQDFDSVHHAQSLIAKYLTEDVNVTVEKMHKFTDGCVAQYKSRHCIGDFSCFVADFAFQFNAITLKHHMQKVRTTLQTLM